VGLIEKPFEPRGSIRRFVNLSGRQYFTPPAVPELETGNPNLETFPGVLESFRRTLAKKSNVIYFLYHCKGGQMDGCPAPYFQNTSKD
jgi:hypothetical protein